MGLTAEDFGNMDRLVKLAANPQKSKHSEIYLAIASLYRVQAPVLSDRERTLMREILQRLAHDVEMAIRISLAERLADDPDAPVDLILLLADDMIEVARPVILRSKSLSDQDIVEFLARADVARQTACAERAGIGEPVTGALARSDAEPVLVALVRNATARIAPATFETLVEKSRQIVTLQEPLAQHPDLPAPLANRMCEWVSEALKIYIVQSRKINVADIGDNLDRAAKAVQSPPSVPPSDSGRKLIEKLAIAGQIKAGFLLRVLQQGQTDLFDLAFAKLLEVELQNFHEVFYRKGARPVALACRAVGIDRCVFPTVYNLSRQFRSINSILSDNERAEVDAVFGTFTRPEALQILRHPIGT
ncbi:MAG: DUF2336 domain-containing protein [Rhizomicrobium sp.]